MQYPMVGNSITIPNYSCNDTGYETSQVMTNGVHNLKFQFGNDTGYANNYAITEIQHFYSEQTTRQTVTTNTYTTISGSEISAASLTDDKKYLIVATAQVDGSDIADLLRIRTVNGTAAFDVSLRDALIIGVAQSLALVPGVSRSGATISAGLWLGYRREEAARFSFLLATPITAGAALMKVPALWRNGGDLTPVWIGMACAAVFGYLAIRVLLAWVRTRDYRPFVFYRWAFSALVLAALVLRGGLR